MLLRSMKNPMVAAIAMLLPVACHAAAFGTNGALKPPDFNAIAPDGAAVTGFSIEVDCAGVGAVRNVPDGWSFGAEVRGENYVVDVERPNIEAWLGKMNAADRKNSNSEIEAIRLDVLYRGQWSDCVVARAVVHLKIPQAAGGWTDSDVRLLGSMFEAWKPDPSPAPLAK